MPTCIYMQADTMNTYNVCRYTCIYNYDSVVLCGAVLFELIRHLPDDPPGDAIPLNQHDSSWLSLWISCK